MPAPQSIITLVGNFDRNYEQYKKAQNETQVRREFIDPFFKELGWDIDNSSGAAPQYQDVVHEDQLKISGSMKAPDYAFRIGGQRKFYVEAKKPSIVVKNDPSPALQVRTYAWNAKLDLSIVTDFEEFAIYECSSKPKRGDMPSVGRVNYFTYKDYLEKWDEIYGIFSKEAVIKGSFDKYATGSKGKRGTQTVDKAFLQEIEHWREILAKNFAKNNKITEEELKFATQRTLDRIIFLRICEARRIEEEGKLQEAVSSMPSPQPSPGVPGEGARTPRPVIRERGRGEGSSAYERLFKLFQAADNRYNSGLFYFRKGDKAHSSERELDTITPRLKLDDKVLKEIIGGLYYPTPYLFDVIPADILGQVYEQFLGKVIRLTPGGMVKIEEKPEVRKAGGVYYTPTYIVDYIVKNTVGKKLEGRDSEFADRGSRNTKNESRITILDPACGSGSFLLGAYNYLLHWYLGEYSKNANTLLKQKNSPIYETGSTYALTTPERKRILLEHIYGVDIDEQAVEVAKLNLMLKCLEGEAGTNLKLSVERILPDLSDNIKCGNSLIGPDFYDQSSLALYSGRGIEGEGKINPFDWNSEFSDIMKKGGFDVVIGNPPYVRQEGLGAESKEYFERTYSTYASTADLYTYFIEKAHKILKQKGCFGMITSNKFMRTKYGFSLRKFLTEETTLIEIVDFGELPIFQNASTFPAILITTNQRSATQSLQYLPIKSLSFLSIDEEKKTKKLLLNNDSLVPDQWTLADSKETKIFAKLKTGNITLKDYVKDKMYRGILTGMNEAFVISAKQKETLLKEDRKSTELLKPFISGKELKRYKELQPDKYLILIPSGWTNKQDGIEKTPWAKLEKRFPAIAKHLKQFENAASVRFDKGDYWWELRKCAYYPQFETPKIMLPDIAKESRMTYDEKGLFFGNTGYIIATDDLSVLGILNSKLIYFYYKRNSTVLGDADKGGRLRWIYQDIKRIPFPANLVQGNENQKKLANLVNRILILGKELSQASTPQTRTNIERQIAHTDNEIDKLVYELYGLTEEEIKVIEGKAEG